MTEISLTQIEADKLIAMEKHRANDDCSDFPFDGDDSLSLPLHSPDNREKFILDIRRSRIISLKGTYQNRARQAVVLIRLDFGGAPHRNPDDEDIPCPHLHIYREGFGDKYAIPAPIDKFSDITDLWRTLEEFMLYCNITKPPCINKRLFI